MKINKCSASAISSYRFCIFQYYLNQVLGLKTISGKAALQGTIIHNVFETMAKINLHDKNLIDPFDILEKKWDKHVKLNPHIEIRKITTRGISADFKKCQRAIEIITNDNIYNPYKIDKIIGIENWFAFEHKGKQWTTHDGSQFRSRGFIDLVHEIDDDTIEIVDFKSGKRQEFGTFKEKDFWALLEDIQPRLYHLAALQLWPEYDNIIVTFYYILDGGPISFCFSEIDTFITIGRIQKFFKTVKNNELITRNRCWKCNLCSFNKGGFCDKIWSDFKIFGQDYIEQHYKELTFREQQDMIKKGE